MVREGDRVVWEMWPGADWGKGQNFVEEEPEVVAELTRAVLGKCPEVGWKSGQTQVGESARCVLSMGSEVG